VGRCPKRISKGERPIRLVGLDLIIDLIVGGSLGIVFLITILESRFYVLFSLSFGGGRLCVAFKLFLIS
jgi:hypothetical protein